MDILTVKAQIKNKKPDKFYIFTGEEWEVQRIYVNKVIECGSFRRMNNDSVADVFNKLRNKSIFSRPTCYVIRDDTEFVKNETAWSKVEEVLEDNILILKLSNVDKRGKFYKHYKDKIIDFERLSDDVLIKYIQREINLSERNCRRLIDICDGNYGRILLEIDKIKHYPIYTTVENKSNLSDDSTFEWLIAEGVIYQPPKDVMFDWVDAVLKRKVNDAFSLYVECERKGVSVLVMLSVLYTNTKQVLQVQDCMRDHADIAKSTGLSSYQIKLAKDKCGYYGIGELVYMLKCIRATEVGIKTGKVDEKTAIPRLLVDIL